MRKGMMIGALCAMGISFSAWAIVGQNSDDALSYKNMVTGSSVLSTVGRKTEDAKEVTVKTVDLRSATTNSVSLSVGDEVEVILPTSEYTWKVKIYDSSKVAQMVDGTVNKENERILKFKRQASGSVGIYFIGTNASGDIKDKSVMVN
ncbi:MAG: hypothetical protein PUH03_03480 [bacterium]|nr:hypothetical protein [bacterium]MDY2830456.1 hypothetical protein [Alphaproteobacteria bacterium]